MSFSGKTFHRDSTTIEEPISGCCFAVAVMEDVIVDNDMTFNEVPSDLDLIIMDESSSDHSIAVVDDMICSIDLSSPNSE